MSDAVTEFRRSFRVGKFQVALICPLVAGKPIGLRTEWHPYYPGGLSGQAFRQYSKKRDACLLALAEYINGAIVSGDGNGFTALLPDGNKEVIHGTHK